MKRTVGVFMGGYSPEWEISLESGRTVLQNLDKNLFNAYAVIISKDGWYVEIDDQKIPLNRANLQFEWEGSDQSFDVIYNAIHGHPGEDGYMQALFELNNLPHCSAGFFESALTFNKHKTNELLRAKGIAVAKSWLVNSSEEVSPNLVAAEFGFPLFIKPNRSGSSFGVTRVSSEPEIEKACASAFHEDSQILIEQAIQGIEVGCGVVKRNGKIEAIAVTEIRSKKDFFDYEAKYQGASDEITPAEIDQGLYQQICALSEQVYAYLDLWGVVRIDYIIQDNTPYLIEVNSIPGLSPASIVPQQMAYRNWALGEFFGGLLEESILKHTNP